MPRRDEPQPALGAAVRELREARGLSQERLAQRAGVTTATVSLMERGRGNPAWGTVKAIAAGLDVGIGELAKLAERLES